MLTVVIQAGGESRRIGGNKALIPFLGEPLIVRVLERVRPLADELLITANDREDLEFLGLPIAADLMPGKGALGGLYTALDAAQHPLVAVVACDLPFASRELLAFERDLLVDEAADAAIPATSQGYEPLHAVYRKTICLPAVERALLQGECRMISWFADVIVRMLTEEEIAAKDPTGRAFFNINTIEDLLQAENLARDDLKQP